MDVKEERLDYPLSVYTMSEPPFHAQLRYSLTWENEIKFSRSFSIDANC
jgi:hypothetical protein